MSETEKRISFDPDDQDKGGGNFDDVDVRIVGAKTGKSNFPNKAGQPTTKDGVEQPVGIITFFLLNAPAGSDPAKHTFTEMLGAGDASRLTPTDDETGFKATDPTRQDIKGVTETSTLGIFFAKLREAGMPKEKFSPDFRFLIGLEGHKRNIKVGDRKNTVPTISKIIKMPDGSGMATPAEGSGGGSAAAHEAKALELIGLVLEKVGKPVEKVAVGQAISKKLKETSYPEPMAVAQFVLNDKWLRDQGAHFSYDGTKIAPLPAGDAISI